MHAIIYNESFFTEDSMYDLDDEFLSTSDWMSKSGMDVQDCDKSGARLSLAYEKLTHIPKKIAEKFAKTTKILDLSHNSIRDLSFLQYFLHLNTLILDKNPLPDEKTFPLLPNLEVLWLNHCQISNIQNWIYKIRECCPQIKHLSLMGNPGATSVFNGNSILEHNEYRMLVISVLPMLKYLDDSEVTGAQKQQAATNRYTYNLDPGAFNIFDNIQRKENSHNQRKQLPSLRNSKGFYVSGSEDS